MKRLITPACLMVVCLLVLAEVGARVFFAQDISGRFDYGYNPQAGFNERADGTVKLFRAGGRRFHPQSFKRHRPPGTFRIFVVGDSVPRGPSFKTAYPWFLGDELRRHDIAAESINLAVPGYGPRRCQVVLQKILEYEPSLVVLHINDTNKWEDEREWRRSQEFKGWHPRHWLMKVFIFRRLYEAKLEKVFWPLVPEAIRLKYAANDADAQVAAAQDPREIAARIRLAEETAVGKCGHAAPAPYSHHPRHPVPAGRRPPAWPLPQRPRFGPPGGNPGRPGGLSYLHEGCFLQEGFPGAVRQFQRPLEPGRPSDFGSRHLRENRAGAGRLGTSRG